MRLLEGLAFAFITFVILAASAVRRPEKARCPKGMYLHTGVRTSGRFECARQLLGPENDAVQPAGVLGGHIYCSGGSTPIVVDHRTVGCTRRFL